MGVLKALLSPNMYTLRGASILSILQVVVQILRAYKSRVGTSPINHYISGYNVLTNETLKANVDKE
jgi:hypothetical protein